MYWGATQACVVVGYFEFDTAHPTRKTHLSSSDDQLLIGRRGAVLQPRNDIFNVRQRQIRIWVVWCLAVGSVLSQGGLGLGCLRPLGRVPQREQRRRLDGDARGAVFKLHRAK